VVRLVDARIRVQPVVDHDPVDEIVNDRGDVVDAAEPLVERGWLWFPASSCFALTTADQTIVTESPRRIVPPAITSA
jgi:hypothetical protein